MLKFTFRFFAFVGVAICLVWVIRDPKFDSFAALAAAAAAVLGSFIHGRTKFPSQAQTVSSGSTGIQAGGDIKVDGDIVNKRQK